MFKDYLSSLRLMFMPNKWAYSGLSGKKHTGVKGDMISYIDMFDIGLVKPNHEWVLHPIVYVFVITYPYPNLKTDLDHLFF